MHLSLFKFKDDEENDKRLRFYVPTFGCFEAASWAANVNYYEAYSYCKNRSFNGNNGHLVEPTSDALQFMITGLLLHKNFYKEGWWMGANTFDYVEVNYSTINIS